MEIELNIPFGPQHPAFKEPINFRLSVVGERIVAVEPRLGYNHRGIEKAAEARTYLQNLELVERICGICAFCHSLAFSQGVEQLFGVEAPPLARYIRTIMAELERIHSHYLWAGFLMYILGFETIFMHIWRDREIILRLYESISGGRVHHSLNTLGGVRRGLKTSTIKQILKSMTEVRKRTEHYKWLFSSEPSIVKRTRGIGVLPTDDALKLFAVGPVLRASELGRDIRKDSPYAAYEEVDFIVTTRKGCDVEARLQVRLDEVLESIGIIEQCIEKLPTGELKVKTPRRPVEVEVFNRVEAPRGELFHYIKSNGNDRPYRFKVKTPTLANFSTLPRMLSDAHMADVSVIISSIDPCIACCERLQFIDIEGDAVWVWNEEELRSYSLRWYGNR
jgi:membrane-bound hydrogenase subunit alpha